MYLFLDIDGVLAPIKNHYQLLDDGFIEFDENCVNVLNTILEKHKIETLVLSTSHRYNFSIEMWKNILIHRGIRLDNISKILRTEKFSYKKRVEEIENFIYKYNINNFLIIDDDKSLYHFKNQNKIIHTLSYRGLSINDF